MSSNTARRKTDASETKSRLKKALDYFIENIVIILTLVISVSVVLKKEFFPSSVSTDQLLSAVVLIIGFLAMSEIIERRRKLSQIEATANKIFFEIADLASRTEESPSVLCSLPDFTSLIRNSQRMDFEGIALTSVLDGNVTLLRDRLAAGAHIRILLIDPNSPALAMTTARSDLESQSLDYFRRKVELSMDNLTYLVQRLNQMSSTSNTSTGILEVRSLKYAPTFGLYLFEPSMPQAVTYVDIYANKGDWHSAPSLRLEKSNNPLWHAYFSGQFENMWKSGTKVDFP